MSGLAAFNSSVFSADPLVSRMEWPHVMTCLRRVNRAKECCICGVETRYVCSWCNSASPYCSPRHLLQVSICETISSAGYTKQTLTITFCRVGSAIPAEEMPLLPTRPPCIIRLRPLRTWSHSLVESLTTLLVTMGGLVETMGLYRIASLLHGLFEVC